MLLRRLVFILRTDLAHHARMQMRWAALRGRLSHLLYQDLPAIVIELRLLLLLRAKACALWSRRIVLGLQKALHWYSFVDLISHADPVQQPLLGEPLPILKSQLPLFFGLLRTELHLMRRNRWFDL